MERFELEARLGAALKELTPEQVDRLHQEAEDIDAHYQDQEVRDAALSAAVQYLRGELTPEMAAWQLRAARAATARASAVAKQVAKMLVDAGVAEVDAAPLCGITRDTLRARLGKKKRGCRQLHSRRV